MKYTKKVSVGAFAEKGKDIKDGDIVTIASEGKQIEGKFGMQDVFLLKLTNGEEKNFSLNQTSINNIIDAFGEDSVSWIGKQAKVWAILSNVQGKMIKVYYLSHPDAEISEEGDFILHKTGKNDIPVIGTDVNEIDTSDIPL